MKRNLLPFTTFLSILFFSLNTSAWTHYWVGGSGSWTDINHWATTSGGSTQPSALPDSTSDVIFDSNSFPSPNAMVNISVPLVKVHNFQWNSIGAVNAILNFNFTVIECNILMIFPSAGNSAYAASATFKCDSMFYAGNVNAYFGSVEADIVSLVNCAARDVRANKWLYSAWNNTTAWVDNAEVGTDTCTDCGMYFGMHCGTAVLRGLDFRMYNPQLSTEFDFDSLEFATPGGFYYFPDSDTVAIHEELIISSQAGNPITLQTVSGSFPHTFLCDMPIVCADYIQLQNMNGGGATQFYAGANSTDLGGNSGWQFQPCISPLGYYWVGGSGNWSDLNHWATTSGGSTFHITLPGNADDVYFDVNSFPSGNPTVSVDLPDIFCRTMDWTSATNNPTFRLDSALVPVGSLTIGGSLLLTPAMDWHYGDVTTAPHSVSFASAVGGNQIMMAGHSFYGDCRVFIGSAGSGGYELQDDLSCYYLSLNPNTFTSNGYTINVFDELFPLGGTLDLTNSTINAADYRGDFAPASIGVTNTVFNANFFDAEATAIPYPEVHANSISCVNCSLGLVTANYFNGDAGHVVSAEIGNDNCVSCGIYVSDFPIYFESAVCRGINFTFFNLQNNASTYLYFDSLVLGTIGGHYLFNDTDSVVIHDYFMIANNPSDTTYLSAYYGSTAALLVYEGSDLCVDYLNLSHIAISGGHQYYAGANSIDNGDNPGWQFTTCNASNVWPGDANYDLTATNLDILYIGIAFGESGPVRAGASNSWVAQPSADWSLNFPSGQNMKHGDCDGNGLVEVADTVAVYLNYGLTHPARLAYDEHNGSNAVDPELSLVASPDTVIPGEHVHVDINLGTSAIPVDSIYGIAFTVNYDDDVIDPDSVSVDFSTSWLGTIGVDMIGFHYTNPGQIDFALTRTNHVNAVGGNGTIASFDVVIVDNISTSTGSVFRLSNVTAMTYTEYLLSLSKTNDSIVVDPFLGTNSVGHADNYLTVFPNPVAENLSIDAHGLEIIRLEVIDLSGQVVMTAGEGGTKINLNVDALSGGVYHLRCETEKGVLNKRIEIIRN